MIAWRKGPPPSVEGVLAELAYNPETGQVTRKKSSGGMKAGSVAGYVDQHGYVKIMFHKKSIYAHRVAWAAVHGEWPITIDHINGCRTDNRIENLRSVTLAENNQNIVRKYNNITHDKRYGTYYVNIVVYGRHIYAGAFKDKQDAIEAVAFARRDHGQKHRHAAPLGALAPTAASKVTRANLADIANKLRRHKDAKNVRSMCLLAGVSKSSYKRALSGGYIDWQVNRQRGNFRGNASE